MLKLTDLKKQGLTLSKMDAQELHPLINEVAQRGHDNNIIFEATGNEPKEDPLKAYYAEMRQRNGDLLKENFELKKQLDAKPKPSTMIDNIEDMQELKIDKRKKVK